MRVAQSCFGQEPDTMQKGTEYNEPLPIGECKQEQSAMDDGPLTQALSPHVEDYARRMSSTDQIEIGLLQK